ncbi:hypothetical protein [Aquisediminimonas profunda]|uniref:hypothetical protein n=1 Tax=Aquisediminimonas profunda TaxID=1550733 RepID=UPI001C633603|nr:hypothetical protein [Aquisediminimonas profunda]
MSIVGQEVYADEALALDYALGILIDPDLGDALQRMRTDADFALLVARYRVRLGSGVVESLASKRPNVAPPAKTWEAIMAKISGREET